MKPLIPLVRVVPVAVLLLGFVACETQEEPTSEALTEISVRLKWVFDPGFAGEMVAVAGGFFEEQGLDVSLNPGGFEADPIRLVAAGADQIGVTGADQLLIARSQGVPIVAIASGYSLTPVGFYVRADSEIEGVEDFPGHKVGYQAGQDTGTIYEALLELVGVDRTSIDEIPVRFDFTPFLTGAVEVWPGYVPTQSFILEQQGIPFRIIQPTDYGLNFVGTVYFVREDFLAENEDVLRRFVRGLRAGWEFTYAQTDSAVALIRSFDPSALSEALVRDNLESQLEFVRPPGYEFLEFHSSDWEATIQTLSTRGLLETPVPLESAVFFGLLEPASGGD